MPRARYRNGGGLLRSRPRIAACQIRGLRLSHRPRAFEAKLSGDGPHHRCLQKKPRRSGASGLRLFGRECRLRAALQRRRHRFHRSVAGSHRSDGRQGQSAPAHEGGGRAGSAGLRRHSHLRRRSSEDHGRDRLSLHAQGGGGRRRQRVAPGALAPRSFFRLSRGGLGGRIIVRRPAAVRGKIYREAAPRRDSNPRRQIRPGDSSLRPRMLDPAAPSEGHRRSRRRPGSKTARGGASAASPFKARARSVTSAPGPWNFFWIRSRIFIFSR